MTRVFIRTDASMAIGFGHFSRCLALAGALRDEGATVTFIMCDPAAPLVARLAEERHGLSSIPAAVVPGSDEDAAQSSEAVEAAGGADIIIVDHYRIAQSWERRMRSLGSLMAVIDDLADRVHDCDFLIDQNRMFDGANAYRGLVPDCAQVLVGPRYALLRPEFSALRGKLQPHRGSIARVAIAFGGSDPADHSSAALAALRSRLAVLDRVDLIVGALNPRHEALRRLDGEGGKLKVHVDTRDVARIIAAADLVIGAGGVMSWERTALLRPAIALGIAPNQFGNIADLLRAGVAVGKVNGLAPEADVIARCFDLLVDAASMVHGMSERCADITDGGGACRVARTILPPGLAFRPATAADCEMVHAWRNHADTRAYSGDAREIPLALHRQWFARSLADPGRVMVVAERRGEQVGFARFDSEGKAATISVFRNPAVAGRIDIVRAATDWFFAGHPEVEGIKAIVIEGNAASVASFERSGYILRERHYLATRRAATSGKGIGE